MRALHALLAAVAVLALCSPRGALSGDANNCKGVMNTHPIYEEEPEDVRSVTNGKLQMTGSPSLGARIRVIHLYGTAYERGYAHGELMKEEITEMYSTMLGWIYGQIDAHIQSLPAWLRNVIEKDGVEAALEVTYWLTKPYIPQHFLDEVSGIANATGLDHDYVMRIQLFPSLIQAACSMMGAWGEGIAGVGGSLYQLRALDWGGSGCPMTNYPAVIVSHPTDSGHAFTTVGWVGWIGALTGYSSADVAICEKVWIHYKGSKPRNGQPWHFRLRDILQFDETVEQGLARLNEPHRTCSIFVGLGSTNPAPGFTAVEYSNDIVHAFNDSDFPLPHPAFKDVVYVDKHTQPSGDPCMPALIKQYYGSLNATNIIQIAAQFETGNMHAAVFDFSKRLAYVSNASPPGVNGTETPAFASPWTRIDLAALFAEKV